MTTRINPYHKAIAGPKSLSLSTSSSSSVFLRVKCGLPIRGKKITNLDCLFFFFFILFPWFAHTNIVERRIFSAPADGMHAVQGGGRCCTRLGGGDAALGINWNSQLSPGPIASCWYSVRSQQNPFVTLIRSLAAGRCGSHALLMLRWSRSPAAARGVGVWGGVFVLSDVTSA